MSGRSVQSYLSQYQFRRSVRDDIGESSDINVIIYDIDKATSKRSEILDKWSILIESYRSGDDT